MANPCSMKQHKIHGWTTLAQRINIIAGCVENQNQPALPMANPDLRGMVLPPEWNAMTSLTMTEGNTTHLPPFPATLTQIHIDKNRIQALSAIPPGVRWFTAHHNQIAVLPPLPPTLQTLDMAHNNLSEIPTPIPATLTHLSISHNNIQSLPSLAHTEIWGVGLGFNQLTSLPELPDTIRDLGCVNNQITEIQGLPDRLDVLICSNNPLRVLRVDNLTRLRTLIANNCGLKHIPILPASVGGDNDDNNDNGANNGIDEDRREYYFDNNPLTPEFAEIYQRYKDARTPWQYQPDGEMGRRPRGTTRQFRQEVLAEHRRMLRQRAATLSALQQTFKAPMREETGPNWYYGEQPSAAQKALQGNYGPTNLIAQFITGLPGTLERQKLGVLEQREAMGNVPRGTGAAARRDIADIIADITVARNSLNGPPIQNQNTLAERAKLYVERGNIEDAKLRAEAEVEENAWQDGVRARMEANREFEENNDDLVEVRENNNNNNGEALQHAMAAVAADNAAVDAALDELDENNQDGGRRKHRTRSNRNRKSKRHTRKH